MKHKQRHGLNRPKPLNGQPRQACTQIRVRPIRVEFSYSKLAASGRIAKSH